MDKPPRTAETGRVGSMRLSRHVSWRLFFSLWMLSVLCPAKAEPFVLAAFEYPPIYQDRADKGLSGDIALAALKAAGMDARIKFFPAARFVWSVTKGEPACGIGGTILFEKEIAEKSVIPGEVLQYVSQTFFYDTRRFPEGVKYTRLEELNPFAIGALHASGIMKFLQKTPGLALHNNSSHEGLARQLATQRLDLWAAVDLTGFMYLQSLYPAEAHHYAITRNFNSGDVSFICSTRNAEHQHYLTKFSEGMAKIKADGTYLKIMAKYYGGKEKINPESLAH